jgi:uncharacterized membrane protein
MQSNFKKNILTGLLTLIPLWITWLVLGFLLRTLIRFGTPWVVAFSVASRNRFPALADLMLERWFHSILAALLALLLLYLLGWFTTHLFGKKIISFFERIITRIPLVQTIYGSTKKLIEALGSKPGNLQRVVLIDFPSRQMKTVGFVTRIMKDTYSGRKFAAVYVPTTPNPTSGYLEIVPLENTIATDWSIDEAMTFIISGGAVAPEHFLFEQSDKTRREKATSND